MAGMIVNGTRYEIDLVVFDKDGLMFQSQAFWKELAEVRLRTLQEVLPETVCRKWARVFGVQTNGNSVIHVDPSGVFATASPKEEMAVTAGLVIDTLSWTWPDARSLAVRVFNDADERMSLKRALVPQKGFPEIFYRLQKVGIPYAVATSDTRERVNESLWMFDVMPPDPGFVITPENVKRGKPFPDMLLMCAERASVSLSKVAMIGDSFVDVQMARDAGAVGIGIPETDEMRDKMMPFTSTIVRSLDEIIFLAE